jgi:molybdopterin-binding protein
MRPKVCSSKPSPTACADLRALSDRPQRVEICFGHLPAGIVISDEIDGRLTSSIPEETKMKLSARNQFKGKIVAVTKGQTTAHVRIDIGGGVIVTSSITNEAVDDLALRSAMTRSR